MGSSGRWSSWPESSGQRVDAEHLAQLLIAEPEQVQQAAGAL